MTKMIPKSRSRKVNGYVKAMLALEAVRCKREQRYKRFVRGLDRKLDLRVGEVETRRSALTGGQQAEARWILGAIPTVNAFTDVGVRYPVPGLKCSNVRHPEDTFRERQPQGLLLIAKRSKVASLS